MLPQSLDEGTHDQALHTSSSTSTNVDEWPHTQHSHILQYRFIRIMGLMLWDNMYMDPPLQPLQTPVPAFQSLVESTKSPVQPFQSLLQSYHSPAEPFQSPFQPFQPPAQPLTLSFSGTTPSRLQTSTQSTHQSGQSVDENPFWVCFVCGNISRNGCKGKIGYTPAGKPLPPPSDPVLCHQEYVIFQNPRTDTFQQSQQFRNVYYHAQKMCVVPNFPGFNPATSIKCYENVKAALCSHLLIS